MSSITSVLSNLGRPVVFYPALAKKVGLKESIFLGQLLYWTPRAHNKDGWVYKTASEIEEEVTLSPFEQRRVRMNLTAMGVLEERHDRLNHRFYYRVVHEALDRLLTSLSEETSVREVKPLEFGDESDLASRSEETSVRYKEAETTSEITSETTSVAPDGATQQNLSMMRPEEKDEKKDRMKIAKRLLDAHAKKFEAKHGRKLIVSGAKDMKLYERLLSAYDEKMLYDLQDQFFQSTDAWIMQSGYSIGAFHGVVNKLVTQGNLNGLSPNLAKTIMALREFVNGSSSFRVIDQEKK